MQFWQWLKKQHNRKRPDFEERGEACVWDPEAVDHLQKHGYDIWMLSCHFVEDSYRLPRRRDFHDLQLHLHRIAAGEWCFKALDVAWQAYSREFPRLSQHSLGTKQGAMRQFKALVQQHIVASKVYLERGDVHREAPPLLPAYEYGNHYFVECEYCNTWHTHGKGDGDRDAKCFSIEIPIMALDISYGIEANLQNILGENDISVLIVFGVTNPAQWGQSLICVIPVFTSSLKFRIWKLLPYFQMMIY